MFKSSWFDVLGGIVLSWEAIQGLGLVRVAGTWSLVQAAWTMEDFVRTTSPSPREWGRGGRQGLHGLGSPIIPPPHHLKPRGTKLYNTYCMLSLEHNLYFCLMYTASRHKLLFSKVNDTFKTNWHKPYDLSFILSTKTFLTVDWNLRYSGLKLQITNTLFFKHPVDLPR